MVSEKIKKNGQKKISWVNMWNKLRMIWIKADRRKNTEKKKVRQVAVPLGESLSEQYWDKELKSQLDFSEAIIAQQSYSKSMSTEPRFDNAKLVIKHS